MRYGILLVLLTFCGCTTNHFSEAILYKQKSNNIYEIPSTGNNPIYVDTDSVFQLKIDYLQPGWIHNGESSPTLDDDKYKGFEKKITSHLFGKELWLLTRIESLSAEDVLERQSKTYYKTTNIKINSESYAKVALDTSEKIVFTHGADNPYRITFKLYEVEGFDLKKAAVRAYDDSPGLAGIFITIGQTISSTLGSLAGSIVTDLWKSASEEQLFIERILLENDATLEFQGTIHILRKDGVLGVNLPLKITSYVLYDKFKSEGWDTNYSDKSSYEKMKMEKDTDIDISQQFANKIDKRSYIKLELTEAISGPATEGLKANGFISTQEHKSFINSIKVD